MAMPPRRQIGGGKIPHLPNDIRFDGVVHFKVPSGQGRCKLCQKNTRYVCQKCNK